MSVIVFAEQREGALRQTALEAVTAGRVITDGLGGELTAVLLGPPGVRDQAAELGRYGADRVVVASSDAFAGYAPEGMTDALVKVIEEGSPKAVVFSASAMGKDLSPRVAARLKAGLATDVTEISVEGGQVQAIRPVYAGKAFARIGFTAEPALLSVRPKAYPPIEEPREARVEELSIGLDPARLRMRVRRVEGESAERPDVAEADIVVSGGRGMQGPENWTLLEDLVDALGPSAALGASRAVVDAGWRPHSEQVGQTGKVVSPQVYFAIGISGAIQHQAGMRTAKCIVAVNRDAEAPIFKLATYGIVGDVFEILPRLTEEIRAARSED